MREMPTKPVRANQSLYVGGFVLLKGKIMSNVFAKIEQTLKSIGALSAIAIPGFIASEWPSKEAADLAAQEMEKIGCDGAVVRQSCNTYFCNWEQA